jgi:hypothetical protein
MIAAVDEFILYDDVQFTKNDWRNRNIIKTPKGLEWLSIPVGKNIKRRIRDVIIPDAGWQKKHWNTLVANYTRAPFFNEVAAFLQPIYMQKEHTSLSQINRDLIEVIAKFLGIKTKITNSWDYVLIEGKTDRLVDLCIQAKATEYISGPAAKQYIEENAFTDHKVKLSWFGYEGYPKHPQLWGEFSHGVSILDLLFNCGKSAPQYMRYLDQ